MSSDEFTPASQGELQRFVRENESGERAALFPVGGRTSLKFGRPATRPGTIVSLSNLTQTIDYPTRDMTITVEAGVRMDDLTRQLKEAGQQLPIDVAQSNRATLGGVAVTNTAGPRRFGAGTMRDYLIGVTAVDAAGRQFHAGGRVVKNVAGYDLCKLLVGSLGSLAIITQLTLKLRPLPESTALLWAPFASFAAIDEALLDLLTSDARPVVLDVLNEPAARQTATESRQELPAESPVLVVGVEGAASETAWQVERLKQELAGRGPLGIDVAQGEQAANLLRALTEFQIASDEPVTFRAGLLPSKTMEFVERASARGIAIQSHAGNGLVIGHLPDKATTLDQVKQILQPLQQLARDAKGNLAVLHCDADWCGELSILGDPTPAWPLMQQLKQTLDPHQILNPGRFEFGDSA